jgi:hypothetical protein
MRSRLSTTQLEELGRYHRALSLHSPSYKSDRNKEEKDLLYQVTQETMAEIYEELISLRKMEERLHDVAV